MRVIGAIKVKSKGGVTQCDVQGEFQTKQLASHLSGYYTVNGPTQGAKLQLDYQFYRNPKQTIKMEGLYSERSTGYRHDMYGDLAMQFTAYPVYDFYAVLRNIVSPVSSFLIIIVEVASSIFYTIKLWLSKFVLNNIAIYIKILKSSEFLNTDKFSTCSIIYF